MMNKKILFLACITAIIIACNNDEKSEASAVTKPDSTGQSTAGDNTTTGAEPGDSIPDAVLKYLDTLPESKIIVNDIDLPNGQKLGTYRKKLEAKKNKQENKNLVFKDDGPAEQLSQLISNFAVVAAEISNDANYQKPAGPTAEEPKQDGLAYNFGSRDHKVRKKMNVLPCVLKVFGLDCSGYIFQIFSQNSCPGMNVLAATQATTTVLDAAIAPVVSRVKAVDKGKLTSTTIQSGDLVYWDKIAGAGASHLGIALKTGNTVVIYQSNGSASVCEDNLSKGRGPRTFALNDTYWFAANCNWKVLRYEVQ